MNWTALYAILKNSINTTKAELEQEITEKIGLTNQFLDELPEVGESGVLYFIPKDDADPSAEDQYFMYVWDPDKTEFVFLDPDMDMSPYAKTADLATVATSGAYSDLSGTPDLTPYITEEEADEKYMSGDVLDDETVTGNPVTFESLDGGHAKSCEVSFGPEQDLHGYESPWPAGGGKNKLDVGSPRTNVNGDVTYVVKDDGTITVNGQASSSNPNTMGFPITLPAGTYTLSGCPSDGSDSTYRMDITGLSINAPLEYGNGVTFTLTQTETGTARIRLNTNYNAQNLVFKPMIEVGSTKTDFAPYSNICPISGRDSVELNASGTNIWDEEWEAGSYRVQTGEKLDSTTQIRCKNLIPILPNTSYYKKSPSPGIYWNLYYDKNKNYLSYAGISYNNAFKTPSNAYYMAFYTEAGYGTTYNHDISINYPSKDTAYHKSEGNTTHTATFSDTVYDGEYDFVSGVGTNKMIKVTITNFSSFSYQSTANFKGAYAYFNTLSIPKISTEEGKASLSISDKFKQVDAGARQLYGTFSTYTAENGILYFWDNDNHWGSKEAFVEEMTELGSIELCYELATPTEIDLTPETIELLKGNNVLFTDGDNIELTAAQLELVKVIANPSGQATGTLSKIQINNDILGIPTELPAVTSSDEGKVLMVNGQGEWVADDIPDGTNTQY